MRSEARTDLRVASDLELEQETNDETLVRSDGSDPYVDSSEGDANGFDDANYYSGATERVPSGSGSPYSIVGKGCVRIV